MWHPEIGPIVYAMANSVSPKARVTPAKPIPSLGKLAASLKFFKGIGDRPTLIIVDSHIGYGSPHKQDTAAAHGEPLGEEEIRLTKRRYGWPEDAKFLVPDGVAQAFADGMGRRGADLRQAWFELFARYKTQYPEEADHLDRMQRRQLPEGWDRGLTAFPADTKGLATRDSSGKVLEALAKAR